MLQNPVIPINGICTVTASVRNLKNGPILFCVLVFCPKLTMQFHYKNHLYQLVYFFWKIVSYITIISKQTNYYGMQDDVQRCITYICVSVLFKQIQKFPMNIQHQMVE